ncbi:MAG: hypothetical protein EOQ57_18160 [Mesorhizobium sp.]|uniref:hypothetical protein n=1 Tax=Mesorhizobium sp. TaxID=1871066 RepID=UPI000FE59C6B|nr:hypothetical protein [Mesorhizobium sp.]RWB99687.1 MAG: hypothetical protein EOQ57_18160 [Mesorhizobium sp.]
MPKTGRSLVGMVAGFIPEWRPVFDRNGGRLHVGIRNRFTEQLTVGGKSIYPEERAGDTYEVTIYSNNLYSGDIRATLKDVQARDEHGSPKYRQYRGRQIPIYIPPPGMGLIDKVRGEPRWTVWLRVSPRFTTEALALLRDERSLFLAVHELKKGRRRWVQNLSLQTTDPAEQ